MNCLICEEDIKWKAREVCYFRQVKKKRRKQPGIKYFHSKSQGVSHKWKNDNYTAYY